MRLTNYRSACSQSSNTIVTTDLIHIGIVILYRLHSIRKLCSNLKIFASMHRPGFLVTDAVSPVRLAVPLLVVRQPLRIFSRYITIRSIDSVLSVILLKLK